MARSRREWHSPELKQSQLHVFQVAMDVHQQGFFHPVSSVSWPSFSNCVDMSKARFSSSNCSMVRSPFDTVPASDGRPASLTKASYDYGVPSLARWSAAQIKTGSKTNLGVVVRLEEARDHNGRRVFGRHLLGVFGVTLRYSVVCLSRDVGSMAITCL